MEAGNASRREEHVQTAKSRLRSIVALSAALEKAGTEFQTAASSFAGWLKAMYDLRSGCLLYYGATYR